MPARLANDAGEPGHSSHYIMLVPSHSRALICASFLPVFLCFVSGLLMVLMCLCFLLLCCRLDRQLTSLQAGSSSSAADPSGPADAADPWQQQQAADSFARMNIHADDDYSHEHEIDYYDHDYDSGGDDDWHEGLSRTPGRRPTQRNAVKHARSNSGGGPGQQQQRQQLTPQQRGPIPRWRQGQGQGRQRGGGNGPT